MAWSHFNQYEMAMQRNFISSFFLTMVKKKFISCGIDVSKAKLDVSLLDREGESSHFIVSNDEEGLLEIVKRLKGFEGKIVLESTGRYHLLSALTLHEKGFHVFVVNPLLSSKYLKANIRKNKTDKIDAGKLAEMAIIEKDLVEFRSDKKSIEIRQKIGLMASLEKEMQTMKAILRGYTESQEKLKIRSSSTETAMVSQMNDLQKLLRKLEKEIEEAVLKAKENQKDILTSIPGVSSFVAALITQFFSHDFQRSPKQWIAYCGMDIANKESGTWKGHGRVSKRGNAYLRKRLFSAAWGAMMHDENFKAYYETLKGQGRKYKEILVIIARKIIRIAYKLLNDNKHYDGKIAFSS